MNRRTLLLAGLVAGLSPASAPAQSTASLDSALEAAEALGPLETVIVMQGGETLAERGYNGHGVDRPTNIKSASKSIMSALVGIAIDRGVLEGADQTIAPLLESDLPANGDPRLADITIGHLLSMQAGLGRTSGANYGRWVASANWVRAALAMEFDDEPGGRMLYSTGSTHLLSAILTRTTGRSTLALAREWLGPLDGFSIAGWERDPQGIYLGGNQMAMTPRSLALFGELYRNGGLTPDGERLIPQDWIDQSWQVRTHSRFNGDGYGYGWFTRRIGNEEVRYGWGHGGQMLYIVPDLDLTVVMTSDENSRSTGGHRDDLHALLADIIAAVR